MMLVYKANMAGPYHKERGIPCQDSFAVRAGTGTYLVAAVADGLGSERFSDIGSSVAVNTAVDYCAEHITSDMPEEEILKVMRQSFVMAYRSVLERADKDGNDEDQYDTTLCMAVYDGKTLYAGQSGDSGMVALMQEGDYLRVTDQQRDEDGNVFPLCWGPEKWVFQKIDRPVSAVLIMTDGVFEQICPPLLKNRDREINIALAERFLHLFDCGEEDVLPLEDAVRKYLEQWPRQLLDDDKTVIALINTDRKPTRLEESYYEKPDWEALETEINGKLSETYKKADAIDNPEETDEADEKDKDCDNLAESEEESEEESEDSPDSGETLEKKEDAN